MNLLQPADRRAREAGDSRAAVAARARLLDAGAGRAVFDAFIHRAAALPLENGSVVVDLGSGSGEALAALARHRAIRGIGIDLSTAAADLAARRHPSMTWVVANADRRLPLLDRGAALVLSMQGRRNPAECARVLCPSGYLLISVPAPDDLIELRERVLGERVERSRAEAVLAEHADGFTLVDRGEARQRQRLERGALLDLLRGTYRAARLSMADRVLALESMEVTLAAEILLFVRRPAPLRPPDRGIRADPI